MDDSGNNSLFSKYGSYTNPNIVLRLRGLSADDLLHGGQENLNKILAQLRLQKRLRTESDMTPSYENKAIMQSDYLVPRFWPNPIEL